MSDWKVIAGGRFLSLVSRGGWEYVTRTNAAGVVAVVAVTDQDEIVLVEQHRLPIGGPVVEIPAGLVGDCPDDEGEDPVVAAERELLEETGFVTSGLTPAGRFVSSAGLSDEAVTFFLARGVTRTSSGGGVGGERIAVHLIPIPEIHQWLVARLRDGVQIDAKVLTALALLQVYR